MVLKVEQLEISKTIYDIYKSNRIDIDYAIYELTGYIDKRKTKDLCDIPIKVSDNKCTVDIDEKLYKKLKEHFKSKENINIAAEIILWDNYFMGMNL